ncbi:hypothetical protein [Geomonas ferrireducens]|uniref:hypothetical protein n=1 Tax=Geomonas ferrireducens TaxID=2570227 RepID=UPI0010A80763|nr:hypothetical protein [Geomonas ferrireducens]
MDSVVGYIRRFLGGLASAILRFKAMLRINPGCDPKKQYEVELWLKILERSYDFQSDYKRIYYEKLSTEAEKQRIRTTLVAMLISKNYSISHKTFIAYVCADIGVDESLQVIRDLSLTPGCAGTEKFAFTLACEKLAKDSGEKIL